MHQHLHLAIVNRLHQELVYLFRILVGLIHGHLQNKLVLGVINGQVVVHLETQNILVFMIEMQHLQMAMLEMYPLLQALLRVLVQLA